jgi:hypothetical protein
MSYCIVDPRAVFELKRSANRIGTK